MKAFLAVVGFLLASASFGFSPSPSRHPQGPHHRRDGRQPTHTGTSPLASSRVTNERDGLLLGDVAPERPERGWGRRDALGRSAASLLAVGLLLLVGGGGPDGASAFDGSGSSVSPGYSPATRAEQKRRYRDRVAADVGDFLALGRAIMDEGKTDGPAWVNFFVTLQRREPDGVGRTYAALADLRGLPTKKANEFEGGAGLLLANTYTKPGKPPDNTAAVRSFLKLSRAFDAIEAAGRKGDATKAGQAWEATGELLSKYLADVDLPASLQDPIYKP